MLDPQDRTVLWEALSPPEGFVLDEGIGTTYTLDLVTLLSAPLAFTLFEWEDAQGQPTSNPVLLLEALRRHIGRLTVFCQAGRIAVPPPNNPLFGYLEDSVVEVTTGREDGIFHPKLWVLRYLNSDTNEVRYRVVCLSRNLTDDRSWDLSLVLEGPLIDRKNAFALNHPLGDFVRALPGLALRVVPDVARQRAERIAEEVRRVDFASSLPEPFDELAFHPIGIEGYRTWPLPESWTRGLVISPFIDSEQAEYLARDTAGSVLISRVEELDRLPSAAISGFTEVFVLAESAEGELEPGAASDDPGAERPQGLHAKLFVCEDGRRSHVFVGSANATTAAFERNVEFLVELIGVKGKVGVGQLLATEPGQASLRSLLVPYESPAEPVDDTSDRKLDDLLNAARTVMVTAGWEFQARQDGSSSWHLALLRASSSQLSIPEGVKVRAWPITLIEEAGARPVEPATTELTFPDAGLAGLTSFLACEVSARYQGSVATTRFAMNLPLTGAPAGRREAILRLILDDPHKVLLFLQFLLNEDDVDPMADPTGQAIESSGGSRAGQEDFVLLESLLRALAHDPARLDQVASVLKELGEDVESRGHLPKGLLDVWPAIWAAREGLRV